MVDHGKKIVVPGNPVPKKRPRTFTTKAGSVRTITPSRTKDAEKVVGDYAILTAGWKNPLEEPVAVYILFAIDDGHVWRADADNLEKLVLDALNGVCYKDDVQVVRAFKDKVRVPKGEARTEITIVPLSESSVMPPQDPEDLLAS